MTFNEGDLVWFYYPPRKPKLGAPCIGPFRVRRCLSNHNYEIVRKPGGKAKITHFDNLRPYSGQNSSKEPATADDELPPEHVTRGLIFPKSQHCLRQTFLWKSCPTQMRWEVTWAHRNDADVAHVTWMTTCSLILCYFLLILLSVLSFFCSSFTVYFLIWGY